MAPGPLKHPREDDTNGGPSRPHKVIRAGEGTREQAIVLDDSDDDGSDLTLVMGTSHSIKTEQVCSNEELKTGYNVYFKINIAKFLSIHFSKDARNLAISITD